jgi:predicted extracellular nuclease
MPIPIMPLPDRNTDKSSGNLDYSFLFNQPEKKIVTASNQDASLLFKLWSSGQKGSSDSIKVDTNVISSKDIIRLKSMGFLQGDTSAVQFTKKGKMVITTMALGEDSQFEKRRQEKKYTEILASMDKRGKKGFRVASNDPKFATGNNTLDLTKLFKNK